MKRLHVAHPTELSGTEEQLPGDAETSKTFNVVKRERDNVKYRSLISLGVLFCTIGGVSVGEDSPESNVARPSFEELKAAGAKGSKYLQQLPRAVDAEVPKANLATFEKKIKPILRRSCVHCHGAETEEGNIRIDTLDPNLLQDELKRLARSGQTPRALVAVDIFGQSADYESIEAICEHYGVVVIEDAAEALGATYRGRKTGRFGRCAAFSFNVFHANSSKAILVAGFRGCQLLRFQIQQALP